MLAIIFQFLLAVILIFCTKFDMADILSHQAKEISLVPSVSISVLASEELAHINLKSILIGMRPSCILVFDVGQEMV